MRANLSLENGGVIKKKLSELQHMCGFENAKLYSSPESPLGLELVTQFRTAAILNSLAQQKGNDQTCCEKSLTSLHSLSTLIHSLTKSLRPI